MIPTAPDSETSPPSDAVLSAVADDHRRAVLRTLERTGETERSFEALVEAVAERLDAGGTPAPDRRRRVRTALHHVDLPKLAACGLIDYDPESKRVRSRSGELIRTLLADLEPFEAPG
jgi:DNA-binding transcriptional ArsR family regulator